MKKIIRNLLLVLYILCFPFLNCSKAFHLVGGYISYQHITGNDYKVNLHVFYDCFFSGPGDSLPLCVKSNSLNYDSTFVMYYDTSHVFPYHPCLGSVNSCLQGGTSWGVSDNVLSCTISLPNTATDWRFAVNLCCRNFVPNTVVASNGPILNFYAYATLDNMNVAYNNSPDFTSNYMPVFCLGVPTINNFNCTDVDGDSLSYSLDSTFTRPDCSYDSAFSVVYLSPYSYLDFLDSSSLITLNSANGALSFTPSMIEASIYSIRVDEYRNGLKIGSFSRQEEIIITPGTSSLNPLNDRSGSLFFYPNPVDEKLTFTFNGAKEITIFNLLGDILISKSFSSVTKDIKEIDVSELLPGVYIIRSGDAVTKFVKK